MTMKFESLQKDLLAEMSDMQRRQAIEKALSVCALLTIVWNWQRRSEMGDSDKQIAAATGFTATRFSPKRRYPL